MQETNTILDKIIARKYKEIDTKRINQPIYLLEKSAFYYRQPVSLKEQLLQPGATGIIAEFKRKSPSKGDINANADVVTVTTGYAAAGATALSVLTDTNFFGGQNSDLQTAQKNNTIPVLRKDFIVDEYQLIEAKSIGADVVLLIAACLSEKLALRLSKFAKSLGMEILMEVHTGKELQKVNDFVDIVGVNNRNLKDFSVDIHRSVELSDTIPDEFVKISESGMSNPENIKKLKQYGFRGFLIGETFMKHAHPEQACREFISRLR